MVVIPEGNLRLLLLRLRLLLLRLRLLLLCLRLLLCLPLLFLFSRSFLPSPCPLVVIPEGNPRLLLLWRFALPFQLSSPKEFYVRSLFFPPRTRPTTAGDSLPSVAFTFTHQEL